MSLSSQYPIFAGGALEPILALGYVPVICSQLWHDAGTASEASAGTILLVARVDCGFLWNSTRDAAHMDYAPGYENAQHLSPRFRTFAEELAAGLVVRLDLKGKHLFEISFGDGHMLCLKAAQGVATATSYAPSMAGKRSPFTTSRDGVEIEHEYFRSNLLDRPLGAIRSKNVLEHVDTPLVLLQDIRRAIGDRDLPVYFETPNAGWMLESVSMWDAIYERVGCWTASAITTPFRRCGFGPTLGRSYYGGQFLKVEARPGTAELSNLYQHAPDVQVAEPALGADAANSLAAWRSRLDALEGDAVIWGAGSRGIASANPLDKDDGCLVVMGDLNICEHQLVAPGAVLPVVAPEALSDLAPDLILISNSFHEANSSQLVRDLGLSPSLAVVTG